MIVLRATSLALKASILCSSAVTVTVSVVLNTCLLGRVSLAIFRIPVPNVSGSCPSKNCQSHDLTAPLRIMLFVYTCSAIWSWVHRNCFFDIMVARSKQSDDVQCRQSSSSGGSNFRRRAQITTASSRRRASFHELKDVP